MKIRVSVIAALALVFAVPSNVAAKDKKKQPQRGMLESMQAVPCGVNERGVSGVGSIFGSVGVQHVNSHEKLCPQYLLRTDEMEYHIRPLDMKHAVLLPIGHEGEFKIKKDRMILKVPDEDKKKTRDYQVVSMQPVSSGNADKTSAYQSPQRPAKSRDIDNSEENGKTEKQVENRPPQ